MQHKVLLVKMLKPLILLSSAMFFSLSPFVQADNPQPMAAIKNLQEGESFLATNKKKHGVKTLPSGLQYKVLKEGKGQSPVATDYVTVNYRGTFINGQEFESSYKTKQPAIFAVNKVIPAWKEALELMKPGAKWIIYSPPSLAYGENGVPPAIGPNTTLVFEIELLSVKSSGEDKTGVVQDSENMD